jgi:uncharacterized membrane protein YphA (DoxX/SURF4 family)
MIDSKLQLEKTYRALVKIILSIWLQRFIRFALGAVFVYSGFIKLMDPKAFARVISLYDLIPESLLAPVAIGLPALELLAGLGLIFVIQGSLSIIFGLLITFVIVLWYGILNNLNIDCGCFSPEEIKSYTSLRHALYRDTVMIAAAIYLYVSHFVSGNTTGISLSTKIKLHLRRI